MCLRACMCVHMRACVYVGVYVHACVRARACVCMGVFACVCVHVHMRARLRVR